MPYLNRHQQFGQNKPQGNTEAKVVSADGIDDMSRVHLQRSRSFPYFDSGTQFGTVKSDSLSFLTVPANFTQCFNSCLYTKRRLTAGFTEIQIEFR